MEPSQYQRTVKSSMTCHRVILAVSSSYLQSKMKKNSQHDITFKKVNSQVLAALIDFIYDGEAVISEAESESFINTAKKWKIRQFLSVRRMKTPVKSSQWKVRAVTHQLIQSVVELFLNHLHRSRGTAAATVTRRFLLRRKK